MMLHLNLSVRSFLKVIRPYNVKILTPGCIDLRIASRDVHVSIMPSRWSGTPTPRKCFRMHAPETMGMRMIRTCHVCWTSSNLTRIYLSYKFSKKVQSDWLVFGVVAVPRDIWTLRSYTKATVLNLYGHLSGNSMCVFTSVDLIVYIAVCTKLCVHIR